MGYNFIGMEEYWKPIKNYEGIYEISNLGNIRSKDRYANNSKRFIKGQLLNPSIHEADNKKVIVLSKDGKKRTFWVHILVASHFLNYNPHEDRILHLDKNGSNNLVSNIRLIPKNIYNITLLSNENKLNYEIANQIKTEYVKGDTTLVKLAKRYNVSRSTISKVILGEIWNNNE